MRNAVPLRIDIELGGPMAVSERHPVLLDGLLLAMLDQRLPLPFSAGALPLATVHAAGWPADSFCWLASALQVQWVGPASDRILHRNARPLELLQDAHMHNAITVDFDRGLTKVTRTRLTVRQATKATAWCIGVQVEVERLVARLQALGPHRHQGLGLVRSVAVTPSDEATSMAWWRPLPAPHHDDPFAGQRHRTAGRAWPPYWDRDLTLQAWWPNLQSIARQ